MKKILLATALAAVTLSSVKAESTPAGKGFYLGIQAGGGKLFASADLKWYELSDGKLSPKEEAGSGSLWFPSVQLNWGYSHRFNNDVTLGLEATVISPAVRLGYIVNDRHHFAFGVHYGLTSVLLINRGFQYLKDHHIPKQHLDKISLDLDAMSGLGGSLAYEYFTQSKNFFRAQLRVDYYGVTGKVDPKIEFNGGQIPFLVSGSGSVWDAYLAFGFGSQW